MRRLLVAIDSSDNSIRALQFAIDLAREHKAIELHLVHAHEPPMLYDEIAVYLSEAKAREARRSRSEDILKPAVTLAKAANVPCKSEILIGDVPGTIVQYAEDNACQWIIMGTRGMGTIANLLIGSVATKVIHLTKLPVTLVK